MPDLNKVRTEQSTRSKNENTQLQNELQKLRTLVKQYEENQDDRKMDLDKSVTVKVTLEKAQREIEDRERKLTVSEQEKETLKVEFTSAKK